jgi:iron complex transport system substrate-binding protein
VRDVVQRRRIGAEVVSLDAHTVRDILDSIVQVGVAAGAVGQAADVVAELTARMERVRRAVEGAARPRVLALEWLEPPFAPGHWVPEMIELAGGENLLGAAGRHSLQTDWPALRGLDPDVLIIMPCGYDVEASRRDADRSADALQEIAPRAIAAGRAWVVNGSAYFNRSGPRFVHGIEILAGVLHPDLFDAPPPASAAVWRPAAEGGTA